MAEEKVKLKVEDLSHMPVIMPPGEILSLDHRLCIPTALLLLLITLVPLAGLSSAEDPLVEEPWEILDTYTSTIYIPAGESLSIHFNKDQNKIVVDQPYGPLPTTAVNAIDRVPEWTRMNLTRTFLEIGSSRASVYGQLIMDCTDDRYLDELAFTISHTPPEALARVYPNVFLSNVEALYQNDLDIDYADIIDTGDSSTVRYYVNESGTRTSFDLPEDIYYWYITLPKITDEDPTYINPSTGGPSSSGEFWRDYVFNHADTSYPSDTASSEVLFPKNVTPPLLKNVLADVDTMWDGESYGAPGGYLNNGTGNRRPFDYKDHAIEKVSNWVEKTLPLNVAEEKVRIGRDPSRSVQPVRIAHNHYGNCGELQDLTIAAARSALIPARGVLNTGEDHVWSEFWERGWHHWDNYWSDGGTGIDTPGKYDADFPGSWGRELTTVFSWRGDEYVETVTSTYSDTALFKAKVLDASGMPVDGARVILATENYYVPTSLSYSTWGHTDENGDVTFEIGDSRNYWTQASCELGEDPADSGGNIQVTQVITGSQTGNTYSHTFNMPRSIDRPASSQSADPLEDGEHLLQMAFDVEASFLHGQNLYTGNTFSYLSDGRGELDLYFVDGANHQKFLLGNPFTAYNISKETSSGTLTTFLTEEGGYAILSNKGCLNTERMISINVSVYSLPTVLITSPSDGVRITHTEELEFTGVAHSNPGLETVQWRVDGGDWMDAVDRSGDWTGFSFTLDTTPLTEGEHLVEVMSITIERGYVINGISITVEDHISPDVSISSPIENEVIVQGDDLKINGTCGDDYAVDVLTISLDGEADLDITSSIVDGNWSFTLTTDDMEVGDHEIEISVMDAAGLHMEASVIFYLTELIRPDVTILLPENNTLVLQGTTVLLSGDASDNVELISLTLHIDGEKLGNIKLPRYDTYWEYDLETTWLDGGSHLVEIMGLDSEGNGNSTDITIIIDGTPPLLNMLYPGPDLVIGPTGELVVRMEVEDDMGITDVHLMLDGTEWVDAVLINGSTWEMTVDVSSLASGRHSFFVEATDLVGLTSRLDGTFTIDADAPSLYFYGGESQSFYIGDTVYINGTISDRSDISLLTITMGDDTWNITGDILDGAFSLSLNTSDLTAGNYSIEIIALDSMGNQATLQFIMEGTVRVVDDGSGDEDVIVEKVADTETNNLMMFILLGLLFLMLIIGVALILVIKRRREQQAVPMPPPGMYPTLPPQQQYNMGPSPAPQGLPPAVPGQTAYPGVTPPQTLPPADTTPIEGPQAPEQVAGDIAPPAPPADPSMVQEPVVGDNAPPADPAVPEPVAPVEEQVQTPPPPPVEDSPVEEPQAA